MQDNYNRTHLTLTPQSMLIPLVIYKKRNYMLDSFLMIHRFTILHTAGLTLLNLFFKLVLDKTSPPGLDISVKHQINLFQSASDSFGV